jgi:hypothetical protein
MTTLCVGYIFITNLITPIGLLMIMSYLIDKSSLIISTLNAFNLVMVYFLSTYKTIEKIKEIGIIFDNFTLVHTIIFFQPTLPSNL